SAMIPEYPPRASISRTIWPFATPPIAGLQLIWAIVPIFMVMRSTEEPILAAAAAASHPACPPPTTIILYFLNICFRFVPRGTSGVLFHVEHVMHIHLKTANVQFCCPAAGLILQWWPPSSLWFGSLFHCSVLPFARLYAVQG